VAKWKQIRDAPAVSDMNEVKRVGPIPMRLPNSVRAARALFAQALSERA
jgi:hypothetical protein